jgi:hypothetical protein
MDNTTVVVSDAVLIKNFFAPDTKASVFIPEYKKLSTAEKEILAAGIRDGSLTY